MSQIRDLTGMRFGNLTVIKFFKLDKRKSWWLCKCDCGNTHIVTGGNLVSGHTKSCGCVKIKMLRENVTKHGESQNRLYHIWSSMKQRCCNSKNKRYQYYGGRGIKICREWLDFQSFYEWSMRSGYSYGLSIDRIDNNGNYEPSNCRWATAKMQNDNKRSNVLITYENETKTLSEWSECKKIPYHTLWNRIQHLGWSIEEALSKPSRGRGKRKLSGER